MDKLLEEAQGSQVVLFLCPEVEDRQKIYSYLDRKFPRLFKGGVRLEQFDPPVAARKKCPSCRGPVYLTKYHFGYMENNQDEWTSGECKECGYTVEHAPNFDNSVPYMRFHNAAVVGEVLRWNNPKKDLPEVSDEEMEKLFSRLKTTVVTLPKRSFGKKSLGEYLSDREDLCWV